MRDRVRVLGLLVAIGMLASACGWPMLGFGPARTGFNPTESKVGLETVGSLISEWTAAIGTGSWGSPAVAKGVVYVGSYDHRLYALDAAGSVGCSGVPKTCTPLWSGLTGGAVRSSPAVVDNVVYLGSDDHLLYAFDAAGSIGCSGTPKTCEPLWTAPTTGNVDSSPVVVNGVVYVGSGDGNLYAFDAAGSVGCSGTPKTCAPLWTAATGAEASSPAVSNGVVYVGSHDHRLYAFDAAGSVGCSGVPKTCEPLWTAQTGHILTSAPAVANGTVYGGSSFEWKLYAFDAAGSVGCSGVPRTCEPLWTALAPGITAMSPVVANGVVYLQAFNIGPGWVLAYDAAGSVGCSGTPRTCTSLWTATTYGHSSPAVANGRVYVTSLVTGMLYAFGLPASDSSG